MPERRWLIPLAFAAIYLIWGSTYLAIRFAIETLPPFLMAGIRFLLAGLLLYIWARRRSPEKPTLANWRAAAIMGGLLLLGGNGLVSWAELHVHSGHAALLVSTIPLFVVLIEWLGPRSLRTGPPRRLVALGVVAGLGGIALLVGPGELLGERIDPVGALVLVVAALSWSFGSTLSRRLPQIASPLLGTAMQMLTGGALLLVVGTALGEIPRLDPAAISAKSLLALGYLIGFGSLLAFTAYVYLLQKVAVAKVATYAYVNPVVALLLGWAFAGESLSPRTLIATAIILGAVILITTHRRKGSGSISTASPTLASGSVSTASPTIASGLTSSAPPAQPAASPGNSQKQTRANVETRASDAV